MQKIGGMVEKHIGIITQERFLKIQESAKRHAITMLNAEGLFVDMFINLETSGGYCPNCNISWEKIPVKNRFADYIYYDPACDCYGRCPECKTSWHREQGIMRIKQMEKCTSCRWSANPIYGRICQKCQRWFNSKDSKIDGQLCPKCSKKKTEDIEI